MRFSQLDRITEIQTGKSLAAVKCLSLSEQYLHDHFPRFPVMPGVLMLEAMFQASMWMVRHRDNFARSMVVLRETKNVKFGDFVEPGRQLVIRTQVKSESEDVTVVQVKALIDERSAVSGRLTLESFNLADRQLGPAETDDYMCFRFFRHFRLLYPVYRGASLPLAQPFTEADGIDASTSRPQDDGSASPTEIPVH